MTLEEGDNEPWKVEEGGSMFPSPPLLQMEGVKLPGRESIAVQPQNKAPFTGSVTLLRTASCVGNLPPP